MHLAGPTSPPHGASLAFALAELDLLLDHIDHRVVVLGEVHHRLALLVLQVEVCTGAKQQLDDLDVRRVGVTTVIFLSGRLSFSHLGRLRT